MIYIVWTDIYKFPPPEGQKLLLKRHDKIYAGVLMLKDKGKYYFKIDGAMNTVNRVADYWAEIASESYNNG